ncbi:hypothetical protein Hanom_Chr01g00072181 [Helianthus anomalus]
MDLSLISQRKMDEVNESDENGKDSNLWIQMRINKPLDEIRKTG